MMNRSLNEDRMDPMAVPNLLVKAILERERRRGMIPEIKKILYATDLSKNSAYAFLYAVDMAKRHNARIVILHSIEPPQRMYFEECLFGLTKCWKKPENRNRNRNKK